MCPLGISVFYIALVLPYTGPVTLQSHIFWGLVFGAGPPSWGAQCGPQTPPSLERTFAVVVLSSHLWIVYLRGWWCGSGHIVSLSSLPISLWFLLYIFSFGKIFSAGLQIVLIDSFSVISCKFRVPM